MLPAQTSPTSLPVKARVLVEIGHPAHVHFFFRAIRRLEQEGIGVVVISRNKDITNALLDRLKIPYRCLSRPASSKLGLGLELLRRWWTTYRILKKERIALSLSISGITTAVPSRLAGVRTLSFTDTEDATISNRIAMPYTDVVITPEFYLGDYGKRHQRYQGLHELAYLQDFDFDRAGRIRRELELPERYVLVRRVANDAVHDWEIKGFSNDGLCSLVDRLGEYGKVLVSSEGPLPASLEAHRLQVPLEHIHAVLAGAQLFVGESPTMAVEASLLGTPAYLVSQRTQGLGNMKRLEELQLLVNCGSPLELETALDRVANLEETRRAWQERAKQFRTGSVNMADYVTDTILRELTHCVP